jgi:hypothetical protein
VNNFPIKALRQAQCPPIKITPSEYSANLHLKAILHIFLKSFFLRQKRRNEVTISQTNKRSRLINSQFVSFLEASKFRRVSLDKHERKLRRRTVWARMSILIGFLIFGWLVIESAQAISLF